MARVFIRPGGKIVGDQFHIPPLFGQGFQFPGHFRLPRTQGGQLVLQPPLFLGGKLGGRAGGAGEAQGAQRLFHGGGLPSGTQQEHTGLFRRGGEHLPSNSSRSLLSASAAARLSSVNSPGQSADKSGRGTGTGESEGYIQPSQASS